MQNDFIMTLSQTELYSLSIWLYDYFVNVYCCRIDVKTIEGG